ncbi:hypothetical protein [uncultured Aquimarina sp.]|uniref:hypothetical protein n=1 Tax=uncultured Aquimarina sp. TaxID=575652 RepID=UPI00260413BB|nr:hypothetical protein [uncultured Aquimarina sp.]
MKTNNKENKIYIILTLTSVFLFTFALISAFAQENKNVLIETIKKENKVIKDGQEITFKQFETESAEQPIVLDQEDRYKLNQDRSDIPHKVTKVIMLDNDSDESYDKMISLFYRRGEKELYDFDLTSKGLAVSADDEENSIKGIDKIENGKMLDTDLLNDEGLYQLTFANGDRHLISVETYDELK